MKRFSQLLLTLVTLIFPVLAYGVLEHHWFAWGASELILITLGVVSLRILSAICRWDGQASLGYRGQVSWLKWGIFILLLVLLVSVLAFWFQPTKTAAAMFYPTLMSWSFAFAFFMSWLTPPTLIERWARLRDPNMPDQASAYLNKLTLIWVVWLLTNGSIALVLAMRGNAAAWALYTGLLSYILMAVLLGGEWLFRAWWLKQTVNQAILPPVASVMAPSRLDSPEEPQ